MTAEFDPMRSCARCHAAYDWRRSSSRSLKMTYCGSLCETSDLGATIEAFLQLQPRTPVAVESSAAVAAAEATLAESHGMVLALAGGCPRCQGDLYLDEDSSEVCVQCGARVLATEEFPPRVWAQ